MSLCHVIPIVGKQNFMLSFLTLDAYNKMVLLEHLPTRLPHLLTMFRSVRTTSFFPARKVTESCLPFKVKRIAELFKQDRISFVNLIFQ